MGADLGVGADTSGCTWAGSVVTHGRVDWCVVVRRTQPVETCHLERKLKYKA